MRVIFTGSNDKLVCGNLEVNNEYEAESSLYDEYYEINGFLYLKELFKTA